MRLDFLGLISPKLLKNFSLSLVIFSCHGFKRIQANPNMSFDN